MIKILGVDFTAEEYEQLEHASAEIVSNEGVNESILDENKLVLLSKLAFIGALHMQARPRFRTHFSQNVLK